MYRENTVCGELAQVATCTWQRTVTSAETVRIVPDACTDIIWNGERLLVAGPDTRPAFVAAAEGGRFVGVRFAPGRAGVLGVPVQAVRDARVDLRELWGDGAARLAEQLAASRNVAETIALLEGAIVAQLAAANAPDPVVQQVVTRSTAEVPNVARLAAELGISERQLLRRCNAALGYGPKFLARVLRFQAFLRQLGEKPGQNLAELATGLGYVDQAHLAHETVELAAATPGRLRAEFRAGSTRGT